MIHIVFHSFTTFDQCFSCGINATILAVVLFKFKYTHADEEIRKEKTVIHQHTTSLESSTEQDDSSEAESQDFLDFRF